MAAFQVKRATVAGVNNPAHTISKNVWETALGVSGELGVGNGGTGADNAANARTNLGLGNVSNTTDASKPVSSATQLALDAKSDITRAINTQTGTSYTLVQGDAGKIIEMTNASANAVIVPSNASVAFPVGTQIDLVQCGAGRTTVTISAGVVIRSAGDKIKLTGQYSGASLYKRATNEWWLGGDIST